MVEATLVIESLLLEGKNHLRGAVGHKQRPGIPSPAIADDDQELLPRRAASGGSVSSQSRPWDESPRHANRRRNRRRIWVT
jgi:hypothetical protein